MLDPEVLSAEKREQILQGARTVFQQDGYEGASMSSIAREAGVSKGTLYNHFENKADLFHAYMQQACQRAIATMFHGLPEQDGAEPVLRTVGRRMIALMLNPERRAIYRMVVAEAERFPELARTFWQSGPRAAMNSLARWITAETASGRLAAEDPEMAADQFFSLCQARLGFRYRLFQIDEPDDEAVEKVVEAAVTTFMARYAVRQ